MKVKVIGQRLRSPYQKHRFHGLCRCFLAEGRVAILRVIGRCALFNVKLLNFFLFTLPLYYLYKQTHIAWLTIIGCSRAHFSGPGRHSLWCSDSLIFLCQEQKLSSTEMNDQPMAKYLRPICYPAGLQLNITSNLFRRGISYNEPTRIKDSFNGKC